MNNVLGFAEFLFSVIAFFIFIRVIRSIGGTEGVRILRLPMILGAASIILLVGIVLVIGTGVCGYKCMGVAILGGVIVLVLALVSSIIFWLKALLAMRKKKLLGSKESIPVDNSKSVEL
ncbi:MAG: hypothetical protein NUV96_02030 [Candidatus Colwellbacteria bacterium]|nr:hypothetical protein [Candidatus Colwellbacteria bacterium]